MKINIKNTSLLKDSESKFSLSEAKSSDAFINELANSEPNNDIKYKMQDSLKSTDNFTSSNLQFDNSISNNHVEISLDKINCLNIIINDNDCSDTFIDNIYKRLEDDAINFLKTKYSKDVNVDNGVIITLDQQYISGPGITILAPYDNNRLGNSDALTLVAENSFKKAGFITNGIECGKKGFREHSNGLVSERVPSTTEEHIDTDKETSFVTICFGTEYIEADKVARCIEDMLARYCYHIENNNIKDDLIYRTSYNDTIELLCKKFNTSINELKTFNNLSSDRLKEGSPIKNPIIKNIEDFDKMFSINSISFDNSNKKR